MPPPGEKKPIWLWKTLFALVRGIGMTLRVKVEREDLWKDKGAMIFCGFHGRSFVFSQHYRHRGWWVIISNSNDGDMQTYLFGRLGFPAIRGSTGRGGVRAAVEGIRILKAGESMAMTPDGPRGPSGVVQGGVMTMAQKSGAGLVPVGISARPCIRVKSWDRFIVPMPFAKAVVLFGEPIYVAKHASEDEVEQARLQLEKEIHRLEAEADAR
jgi:lysophospholipid acyltransferase (LPLAT)-like uncharacterized protein